MQTDSAAESLRRARRLYDEGRYAECEKICRATLGRDPDQPEALSILGYLALRGGAPGIAIECFQRLIELQPEVAGHRGVLATALRQAGRHEEALASQEACVALAPDDAEARQNLASQYAETGQLELARITYEDVIERAPLLGQAHYGLAAIRKYQQGDPHIEQMKAALADDALEPADRCRIGFALGKAHEDLGEYDEAFACYETGNRIKRSQLLFDIGAEREKTERIIRAFSEELRENNKGHGFESELPVFIVGMPRSGSTLVEQIIASHPDVHGAGELPDLYRVMQRGLAEILPAGSELPEAIHRVPGSAWARLGRAYADGIGVLAPGAQRIVDKQLFNYTLVGTIHLMLPQARIIHCVRDPMDTCVSCFTQNFGAERGFTCDLGELGRVYRLYRKIMAHWQRWLPEPMLEVNYEAVVADAEGQARRMIEFLGLDWSESCLAPHLSKRAVITSSLGQVRAPVYTGSLGRARRFEKHLQPLREALAAND